MAFGANLISTFLLHAAILNAASSSSFNPRSSSKLVTLLISCLRVVSVRGLLNPPSTFSGTTTSSISEKLEGITEIQDQSVHQIVKKWMTLGSWQSYPDGEMCSFTGHTQYRNSPEELKYNLIDRWFVCFDTITVRTLSMGRRVNRIVEQSWWQQKLQSKTKCTLRTRFSNDWNAEILQIWCSSLQGPALLNMEDIFWPGMLCTWHDIHVQ